MKHYKRTLRRLCVGMLALALCVRVLTQTGLDTRVGQAIARSVRTPAFASFIFYLELGRTAAWPQPLPRAALPPAEPPPVLKPIQTTPAPPKPPPRAPGLHFTPAQADALAVGGACSYPVEIPALLRAPCALHFKQAGPTVLIVHTHTSEAYTQEAGWEYAGDAGYRTQNPEYSVVRVGKELAETLKQHGISVIHDVSFNDYPSYSGAYARTLTKIEDWLALYPSIEMVIDLHRDAASDAAGNPVSQTAILDGQKIARLMLVIGTDEGGLSHPFWRENLSWGLKLQAILNRDYPGLCRDMDLRTERFNQHATKGSLLVEVGSSGNTLPQAIAAGKALGEGLAALIAAQP